MTVIQPLKPNVNAWAFALPLGLVAYIVFLAFLLPGHDGSNAYQAGRALLPALVPAVVVGIVAKRSGSPWRWWWYPGAVLVPAFLWFGMLEVVPAVAEQRAAEGTEGRSLAAPSEVEDPTGAQTEGRALAAPDAVGHWRLVDSRAAQRRGEAKVERIESIDAEGVYGEYAGPGGGMVFLGATVPSEGGDLHEELQDSPADTLDNMLAGAGLSEHDPVDPGPLRGAMACGEPDQPGSPPGTVVCGWADLSSIAVVTVFLRDLDRDHAVEMVRALRADATREP